MADTYTKEQTVANPEIEINPQVNMDQIGKDPNANINIGGGGGGAMMGGPMMSQQSIGNLFAEDASKFYHMFNEQSIGRLLGDMPTPNDRSVIDNLLNYLPEKLAQSKASIMAFTYKSIAGDQQATAIIPALLEKFASLSTKDEAMKLGLMKLTDPNATPSTRGRVMAAMGNYWDDYYGTAKSTAITQSMGFLAQIGSVLEALMQKQQNIASAMLGGGAGLVTEDLLATEIDRAKGLESVRQSYTDSKTKISKDWTPKGDGYYEDLSNQLLTVQERIKTLMSKQGSGYQTGYLYQSQQQKDAQNKI